MDLSDVHSRLVDAAPDGILLADRDGVIRLWNAGCEAIFGFTAAEAIGQSLDIIIPLPQRGRHWDGYRRTMQTGESRYAAGALLSVPAMRKDGTRISVEFSIVPLRDDDGQMAGMGAILRDVTQRFLEMKALRKAAAAAAPPAAAG